jgi:hypothetical protein
MEDAHHLLIIREMGLLKIREMEAIPSRSRVIQTILRVPYVTAPGRGTTVHVTQNVTIPNVGMMEMIAISSPRHLHLICLPRRKDIKTQDRIV